VKEEIEKRGLLAEIEKDRIREEDRERRVPNKNEEKDMTREEILSNVIVWVQGYSDLSWPWISVEDISANFAISESLAQDILNSAVREGKISLDDEGQIEVRKTQELLRSGLRTAVPRDEMPRIAIPAPTREKELDPSLEEIDKAIEEMEEAEEALEEATPVRRKVMSRSNMLDALKNTGKDIVSSGRTGGQMAASKEFVDGIVTIAKETLPDEISMFLDTEVGEKVAPAFLSAMINFTTHAAPQYVPHTRVVQTMSRSAMDACAYEGAKDFTALMQPFFQRVGQMAASITLSQQEAESGEDTEDD
jgi:hypothetical protein